VGGGKPPLIKERFMAEKPQKKKPVTKFLSPQRIKEIKNDVASLERMLEENNKPNSTIYGRIQDPNEVRKQILKKKQNLELHTPEKLTGPKANKAYEWAKKAEKLINEKMPTKKQIGLSYAKEDSADFDIAVRKEMWWMQNSRHIIRKYRHIMRRLDPSNPTLTNLERLRQ